MSADEEQILHAQEDRRGAFFLLRGGERLAALTYFRADPHRIIINHTEVHPSLKGQGVARRLLDAAVTWARATGTSVGATCSYARVQLQRDASLADVYEP